MGRCIFQDIEGVVMAGASRTLKLSILGDVDQLKKSLAQAETGVQQSASKIGDFSKKVGLAFAAAGVAAAAYAGKLLIDGVKSAIADEAAQARLAATLRNVVGATNDQIRAIESQITKTSLLTGKTDDELRPSFDRLVRSTKNVEEASKLQALALDVSAGSGKSLEAVTNALAKASEGQTTALGKLGVGISAADLKTMSFETITAKLGDTFKNQASVQAETFQGKMDRLKVAFDEGKETVGSFILDAVTPLVSGFVNKVIPAIQNLAEELGPKLTPVFKAFGDYFTKVLIPAFTTMYNFIKDYIVPIFAAVLVPIIDAVVKAFSGIAKALKDNEENLKPIAEAFRVLATFLRDVIAPILGSFISGAISGIGDVISGLINIAGAVTKAVSTGFTAVKNFFIDVKDFLASSARTIFDPLYNGMKAVLNGIIGIWNRLDFAIDITVPDWVPIVGGRGFKVADIFPDIPMLAKGGIVTSPTLAMIGEAGPEAVVPLNQSGGFGNTYNITVNGAVDSEGTARQIVNLLNNSFYRGTGGATALVTS
jgi:phage-related protein